MEVHVVVKLFNASFAMTTAVLRGRFTWRMLLRLTAIHAGTGYLAAEA